jgi:hypothetical protein
LKPRDAHLPHWYTLAPRLFADCATALSTASFSVVFDIICRAMKRIRDERVGAGKISIAPHVDDDLRRFGPDPCIRGWGKLNVYGRP